jgi:3-ketosteroid 9alpha-monooxygenase subunit B
MQTGVGGKVWPLVGQLSRLLYMSELAAGNRVCHRLQVAEVISETADAVSLVFDLTAAQRERFAYRPGQFLTLRLPTAGGPVARCYSLASSPHADERPKVTVKRIAGGVGSNWICDNVTAGAELDVLEPAGVFTPASLDEDLLLIAAGSGVTPIMSIAKSVLAAGAGNLVLCYANRAEDAVIFRDELRSLAAGQPRLLLLHWLESLQGTPTADGLAALLRGHPFGEAFVCGPKPFMDIARAVLRDAGLPRAKVHLERFNSLGGDPFEHAAPAERADSAPTALTVEIGGASHLLVWPTGSRLLDVLAANGLDAPTSCGEGVCASCECRVLKGNVRMVNNQVLDEDDIADGYALACQALPVTEAVHVRF